jgi:hypothetical protein
VWIPRTEAEIKAAIGNGIIRESATFDAKVAPPAKGKNKDLARDICAMTVDGGALLYGIGGSDPTRPDVVSAFDLTGVAERIDQVAQTAIAEPPTIEIHDIPSNEQPGTGYLIVVIPPSPRAPHMVTLDGENRYYGRGATGNRILPEGEVARLYARRERWEVDRDELLDRVIADFPFAYTDAREQIGPMVVVTKPVSTTPDLLRRAAGDVPVEQFVQREIPSTAAANDPFPGQGTSGLEAVYTRTRRGADVFVLASGREPDSSYQARAELHADGTLVYWHSPTVNSNARRGSEPFLMEQSVTRALHQQLAASAFLYERAGYVGAFDIALAVLDIEHASGASLVRAFEPGPVYGAPAYRRHERATTTELRQGLEGICVRLLMPLYDVISVRGYHPYAARDGGR